MELFDLPLQEDKTIGFGTETFNGFGINEWEESVDNIEKEVDYWVYLKCLKILNYFPFFLRL